VLEALGDVGSGADLGTERRTRSGLDPDTDDEEASSGGHKMIIGCRPMAVALRTLETLHQLM
jgi:hypothetical protein